ncbi:MAG: HAD family hydrolase [Pseudomonadota bacterium]
MVDAETATNGPKRAVFLDRDGVLNRAVVTDGRPYPPRSLADLEILPGVADALARFRSAGYLNIVATNQPDITTVKTTQAFVDAIHDHLRANLAIDAIYVCTCVEGPDCPCYKPKPGMLLQAAEEWKVDCAQSFMVGDRWRDVGAGKAARCRTIFVDYNYQERRPDRPDHIVKSLEEAAPIILAG